VHLLLVTVVVLHQKVLPLLGLHNCWPVGATEACPILVAGWRPPNTDLQDQEAIIRGLLGLICLIRQTRLCSRCPTFSFLSDFEADFVAVALLLDGFSLCDSLGDFNPRSSAADLRFLAALRTRAPPLPLLGLAETMAAHQDVTES
jgi:hypothetical protein